MQNKDINKEIEKNILLLMKKPDRSYMPDTADTAKLKMDDDLVVIKNITNYISNLLTKQVEEARLLGKLDVAKEVENKIGDSTCHDIGAAIRYADSLLKKYQKQYITNLGKRLF